MSRLRLILGAGACSIALSGCIPAVAGLALSAANIVTGGGGANDANGFRNPIDKQATARQVKEALSRLDDRVDPACQAMLDEMHNAKAGAPGDSTPAADASKPKDEPRNLLAKIEPGEADVARSAETAPATAKDPVIGDQGEAKPVKAALSPPAAAAPGQCEHRLVCLPGTPKPTLMLMCPGRGDRKDGKATVAGETPDLPAAETGSSAAAAGDASGQRGETATAEAAAAPAATAEPVRASAPAVSSPVPERGVADWNWAHDPAKQL
jgi:hypothetical protein